MQFGFIMSLVFAILIALFAVQNSNVVTIQLIFWKVELSQSVVILASAAIGAIIAAFLSIFKRFKSSLKIRELNHQIKELEQNLKKSETEKESILDAQVKEDSQKEAIEETTEKEEIKNT